MCVGGGGGGGVKKLKYGVAQNPSSTVTTRPCRQVVAWGFLAVGIGSMANTPGQYSNERVKLVL